MLGKKHLHIDERDAIGDWASKVLSSVRSGIIAIDIADEPSVRITAKNGIIAINLLQPAFFRVADDETGLFDKLKTATEFGEKLSNNGVTLSFLRKDKEAIRLGKDAKPSISKLVTRSDDVQISSVGELRKLKSDFKTG